MNVTMRVMNTKGRQPSASDDGFSPAAWERLGVVLRERRGQLDSRYRHRNVFAAEVGLKESLIADLENAKRTSFTPETLAAVENAYRWGAGSIRHVLAGGDRGIAHSNVVALSVKSGRTATAGVIPAPPDDLPGDVVWDELSETERYLWLTPGRPAHRRRAYVEVDRSLEAARGSRGSSPARRR